jgi:hypothetical protein
MQTALSRAREKRGLFFMQRGAGSIGHRCKNQDNKARNKPCAEEGIVGKNENVVGNRQEKMSFFAQIW